MEFNKENVVKLIDSYWKFDKYQDHASTWHDKQDLIKIIESLDDQTEPDVDTDDNKTVN